MAKKPGVSTVFQKEFNIYRYKRSGPVQLQLLKAVKVP